MIDIAGIAGDAVKYYFIDPVMEIIWYSNLSSNINNGSHVPRMIHGSVEELQRLYPELAIEMKMQLDIALDKNKRNKIYLSTN